MSIGITTNGVDLDLLFAPIGASAKGPDLGYKYSGVDISNRYRASSGDDQISALTGLNRVALGVATDLKYYLRDINFGAVVAPAITGGSVTNANTSANTGGTLALTVTATGTTLAYQWYYDTAAIAGATASSYSQANLTPSDAGSYSVVVSNSGGTATSTTTLAVSDVPPTLTSGNISNVAQSPFVLTAGNVANFYITASGTSLVYQWRLGNADIAGATGPSYTFATTGPQNNGLYSVNVSNSAGSVIAYGDLVVNDVAPEITGGTVTTAASYSRTVGEVVNFTVTATGTNLKYQWYFNDQPISGATAENHTFTASSPILESGHYKVTVGNASGSVTGGPTLLTVHDTAIVVTGGTVTGGPYTLDIGNVANFYVTATGSNITYQWYRDGLELVGATASNYTFTVASTDDAGTYGVFLLNSDSGSYEEATLYVA